MKKEEVEVEIEKVMSSSVDKCLPVSSTILAMYCPLV